jgi:hypothetical protein
MPCRSWHCPSQESWAVGSDSDFLLWVHCFGGFSNVEIDYSVKILFSTFKYEKQK